MTTESEITLIDSVQDALEYFDEWFGRDNLTLVHYNNDYLILKIDMEDLVSDICTNAVNWFLRYDWELEEIDMFHQTVTVRGSARKLPCS